MIIDSHYYTENSFAIPYNHPDVGAGVFHCAPAFFTAGYEQNGYGHVLVDAKKVIDALKHTNLGLLDHAKHRLGGITVSDWLRHATVEHPHNMGVWAYDGEHGSLTMSSGDMALLQIVQELNLPCFPVTVASRFANDAEKFFGYDDVWRKYQPARGVRGTSTTFKEKTPAQV